MAFVTAVCRSEKKGTIKNEIPRGEFLEGFGLDGDVHAGKWHRQVSLLAEESIEKMRKLGLEVSNGSFAENITTKGIELHKLPIGTKMRINDVILQVTQIGKQCHTECEIKRKVKRCIMPTEGIFTMVIKGGTIEKGQEIGIVQ